MPPSLSAAPTAVISGVRLSSSGERPGIPLDRRLSGELRWVGSVTPRHQFLDPGNLVVSDPAKHIGEPCFWIDVVDLGGFDQVWAIAMALPPPSDPANVQLFLPIATVSMAR
jgi:hypothetical protein